jgi:HEAT repeat protein
MFLQDEHWSVREAAVTTLGVLQVKAAEEKLLGMLDDPDLAVRKSLLIALGRIDSILAIPTLVKHLAEHDLDDPAYQALTMLATRHKDLMMSHLSNENPKIHLFIEHILGTPHQA